MDRLVVEYLFENEKKEYSDHIQSKINLADIDISVKLGRTNIMINDFLKLNIGDVIRLDNLTTDPVKIKIGDKECYCAKLGLVGSNIGVEVLDVIKEADKDNG